MSSFSPQPLESCPNVDVVGVAGQFFAMILGILASRQCELGDPGRFPIDRPDEELLNEYDFIIVGAGSAGSVLAHRLTEDRPGDKTSWNVLLIEAGTDPSLNIAVPAFGSSFCKTEEDWNFAAEPSPNYCRGSPFKTCYYPRGKVLGGSSAVNFMMYIRGNKKDYDNWDKTLKNGWNYFNMLKYFLKAEGYKGPSTADKDKGYHNASGPLFTSQLEPPTDGTQLMLQSLPFLGYKRVDVNGRRQKGYGRYESTIHKGERWSTARAYLTPIKGRQNLHVIKKSQVLRILWEGTRAVGVAYRRNGEDKEIRASKEVILSGGSLGSPHILQHSGVGPADLLQGLNIPVVMDLPVGENFQDHPVHPTFYPVNTNVTIDPVQSGYEYLKFGKGPLASSLQVDSAAFVSTRKNKDKSWPNIQIFAMNIPSGDNQLPCYTFNDRATKKIKEYLNKYPLFLMVTVLLHPKSRGRVFINSTDPMDPIKIVPNFFEEKEDIETLLDGMEITRRIPKTPPAILGGVKKLIPLSDGNPKDRSYWEEDIKNFAFSLFHPVGTCKMAAPDDPTGVVDPNLKVKGLTGIRVIDASVIPEIISGNTNAPTIAIAEKGADLVKQEHKF